MANVAVLSGWSLRSSSAQGLPIRTRTEPRERQFETCVDTLIDLGIELPVVVDACGAAAAPKALSNCVDDISDDTVITPSDALARCVRVRRPEETADCVVDLDQQFSGTLSMEILGYCSRSLLPAVFENCVEGVADATLADPKLIMDACVEADYDAPVVFLPTFQEN